MELSKFATPIKAKNNFIKASFGGFAGSGKTRTASELIVGCFKKFKIKKPLLIIDNEKGSRFLIPMFQKAGIEVIVKDTTELADVLQAFEYLNSGEIGFLFIDSLSKVWYKYVRDYKAKNKISFMTLQDWGKILPAWQESFSDQFVSLDGNCVFTGRGGFTYDKEEEEKDDAGRVTKKASFVKSGVKMKMAGETPFEPDLNIWMDIDQKLVGKKLKVIRTAQVLKDRSGLIDGVTFINPTFKDFAPVLDFLIGVPVGEVAGASSKENLAPSENWDAQERKVKREVLFEEVKGVFDTMALGSSVEHKKLKADILEKVFGTTSWLAIEKSKIEELDRGIAILKVFKAKYMDLRPDNYEETMEYLNDAIKQPDEIDVLLQ